MTDFILDKISGACPEQYYVLDSSGNKVGYLRLRYGVFRIYADVMDEDPIAYFNLDTKRGMFNCEERDFYLNTALKILDKFYNDAP